jgi:hypothetical protein
MGLDLTGLGGLGSAAAAIAHEVGKLIPDQNLRTQVEAAAEEGARSMAQKALEYQNQQQLADIDLLKAQIELNKAEANSESWVAKNWRPFLAFSLSLVFVFGIVSSIVVFLFGLKADFGPITSLFELALTVLLPLAGIRTLDKHLGVAPSTKTAPKALPVDTKPTVRGNS